VQAYIPDQHWKKKPTLENLGSCEAEVSFSNEILLHTYWKTSSQLYLSSLACHSLIIF
jgi:hypothetical protein